MALHKPNRAILAQPRFVVPACAMSAPRLRRNNEVRHSWASQFLDALAGERPRPLPSLRPQKPGPQDERRRDEVEVDALSERLVIRRRASSWSSVSSLIAGYLCPTFTPPYTRSQNG